MILFIESHQFYAGRRIEKARKYRAKKQSDYRKQNAWSVQKHLGFALKQGSLADTHSSMQA